MSTYYVDSKDSNIDCPDTYYNSQPKIVSYKRYEWTIFTLTFIFVFFVEVFNKVGSLFR